MVIKQWEVITEPFGGILQLIKWSGMATGDEGEAYLAPKHSEKVVAVYGTFGGATVLIDGTLNPASNSYDANFWFPARDVNLADITFTAAGHELVLDHFYGIAPRVTGGAGVDVDVYLLLMRSR